MEEHPRCRRPVLDLIQVAPGDVLIVGDEGLGQRQSATLPPGIDRTGATDGSIGRGLREEGPVRVVVLGAIVDAGDLVERGDLPGPRPSVRERASEPGLR